MLNKIYVSNPKKYRVLNLILGRTNFQLTNSINISFFIYNLDISRINNKKYLLKNKESIPSYEKKSLTDFEKYYNQNYNIKKKYDWIFDW